MLACLLRHCSRCFYRPNRDLSLSTSSASPESFTPLEVLRQKNEVVESRFGHLPEAERFHIKYANFEEVANSVPATKPIPIDAIFANREVRLSELEVYGFDYDYTLVNYTNDLADFIFETTIDLLVSKWKYPSELREIEYDPTFLIRGLHYDIRKGFLMKVDAYRNIQPETVYKGLQPVPAEAVQATYNGLYIPAPILRGSVHTKEHKMTQMMDFFDLPTAYAVCSVVEHFEKSGIQYQPDCIYTDVKKAVEFIHASGLLHNTICNDLERYIKPNPHIRDLLIHLASHAKSLFLISNSSADFINKGMDYVVGKDWERFFDVIIVRANKPDFFRSNSAPFRAVDKTGAFLSWEESRRLDRGQLYQGGNLNLLKDLKQWTLQRVLYFGDHVYTDLAKLAMPMITSAEIQQVPPVEHDALTLPLSQDASNQWGWATAAVIPELENELELINSESYQRDLHRLILLDELLIENQICRTAVGLAVLASWRRERDHLRQASKACFNPRFGSVFRSFHNYSYFAQRLGLYASMYTSSVTNLLHLPINHVCYPRRALLPHEPH